MTPTATGIAPDETTRPTAGPIPTSAIVVTGPIRERYEEILTPEALAFVESLHERIKVLEQIGRAHV